jgi:hypothetical protein
MSKRFNPPPNWPVPRGWQPPSDWKPDPSWPPAPDGWKLWVEAPRQHSGTAALIGGAAVLLGGFIPFVSVSELDGLIQTDAASQARHMSAGFGGLLLLLCFVGLAPGSTGIARTTQLLSVLGAIGYGSFVIAGYTGISDTDLGFPTTVHFTPNIGILMSIMGCITVAVSLHRWIVAQAPPKQRRATQRRP